MTSDVELRICSFNKLRISVIAPARRKRPKTFTGMGKREEAKVKCPFCPGREEETPLATLVLLVKNGKLLFKREHCERIRNWIVRVFPNKYPALTSKARILGSEFSAYGYHEVLVETPIHFEEKYLLKPVNVYYMLLTLKRRVKEIMKDRRIKHISIIKNAGLRAGASIGHPHLQIFANTFTPPIISVEESTMKEYFEKYGVCPLCKIVSNGKSPRTVFTTEFFKVETAYAPRQPYELLIIPKKHTCSITSISDEELKDLAKVLSKTLLLIRKTLGNIDYNYWFHLGPKGDYNYHWHIEIQPIIETWGGYEKSSGVYIVAVSPEDAAREFKENV